MTSPNVPVETEPGLQLLALPALSDNIIWMLHDGTHALVVDPGESAPVAQIIREKNLHLTGVLITHHHFDHVDGLRELQPLLEGPVWGPNEALPIPAQACSDGQVVRWAGTSFAVIDVPGHTLGHVAFIQQEVPAPLLFCGDTLFSVGCGKVFEGTPAQMFASLERLAALPDSTRVCCAHEYTLNNLRWARTVEPHNEASAHHEAWCRTQRDQHLYTLPSTLALERRINPFLRCSQPDVVAAAQQHAPGLDGHDKVAVFSCLRKWKNEFR
ncbi:putative Hydroxyacylglutathione hydrolase [Paratrimastix pyriformis]|uniref:hydroxyacylglutathione hydrolase n=1 Tax=Paratrimastix pyriformis TaxID=342808 RepID=A0ABQ8UU47_9EUKA|nr:putative Hydroxyacylglutathione hydrolase [Paratrimastix pyriformis]